MKTNLILGICVAFIAFLFVTLMPKSVDAGPVVPKTDDSSQGDQAQGLPGLPNYAESTDDDDEVRKRMRRQQQPAAAARPGPGAQYGGGYGQQQMPLPPTYSPGAPASYGQPASVNQLPMSPTAYGTYDSNPGMGQPGVGQPGVGQPGLGQPGMGSAQMAPGQQGAFGLPPSPTTQGPMATSPLPTGPHQAYSTQSPTGVRQQTTPQRSLASQHPQSTVPSGAKPFKDYTRSSPYSPYMSLFRTQDTDRGINNYYSYVKPALDQKKKNQRAGRAISGLQQQAQTQGLTIQQLNQQNQARQRPGNIIPGANVQPRMPATFMNTQQYYPGFR